MTEPRPRLGSIETPPPLAPLQWTTPSTRYNERAQRALLAELGREISALKMELERRQAGTPPRGAAEVADEPPTWRAERGERGARRRATTSLRSLSARCLRARLNEMLLTAQSGRPRQLRSA